MDDTMQPQARHFPRCIGGHWGGCWLVVVVAFEQPAPNKKKKNIYIYMYICIDESKSPQVLQTECFVHHLVHPHHSKCKFFAILQLWIRQSH